MSYLHQHNDSVSSATSTSSTSSSSLSENSSTWVNITIIEDDDLMFGGKPLSTWYEEDRRCSVPSGDADNEDALSPCSSAVSTEEEDRGRRRDRVQH